MANRTYYYCLVAGFPDLFLDESDVHFSMADFKEYLQEELTPNDNQLVQTLFLPYDHQNLINILQGNAQSFSSLGNFSREQLEETDAFVLPSYMLEFVNQYKSESKSKTSKQWENHITHLFYEYVARMDNTFLNDWFAFDKNLTNLLIGLNCREFERNPGNEIIGEDFVAEAIKNSTSKDFGLSSELNYLPQVLSIVDKDNLLNREKELDQLKWNYLENLTLLHYFSVEVVLAYTIKLQMVYRWMQLDEKTGRKIFKQIIDELKGHFEFSKEFLINEQRQ